MTIEAGDVLFLDTNVLLTATDTDRQAHGAARQVLAMATSVPFHLAISGQIVREYLVVATRPIDVNGLGLTISQALSNVGLFLRRTSFYEERREVAETLLTLATRHGLTGKRIHDANIVATMQTHGLRKLLTANPSDFSIFDEIEPIALRHFT